MQSICSSLGRQTLDFEIHYQVCKYAGILRKRFLATDGGTKEVNAGSCIPFVSLLVPGHVPDSPLPPFASPHHLLIMASSTEVKSVAPFSNHSCIPQPLRVLVAQTPFAHHTDAGTDSRQLLAQNDLDIAMKVSPSAILIPITYKMRSVGAEVGNKAASRDFSSPSVSPEARGSPFPEDAYMSFVPVMPTKAPSMIPEIIPLAPRVSSGVPSATPKPTVSAKPVPPPAHGSLIAKPASLSSMKEETVALHWGFPLAAYTELKVRLRPNISPSDFLSDHTRLEEGQRVGRNDPNGPCHVPRRQQVP